ncbi:sirohydrochlorin cobaltochelatase, cobalamin (vitamin B12) biosynthesis CbiX protein [Azoarcus sp. CIB]|uniref:sirohydrochlorin chelatase n=1 Tax=Aromatoleum sp. (strain CIB) TaxID=198107 RepID=UPI00067B8A35|nr:CbiX/SirB N-terminal domain-containing protein [Azoarcus sp. CIB]AKU13884.1 sirohydrochlorin cobaltochelatase, cobalamin (vitamin B12) biosynthesis CbiX protein [Azoarcus sp. CIB]
MSDAHAVVLFGHGARDPEWARPMQRTRDHLHTQAPGLRVELAFLEFMMPTLEDAIAALAHDGIRHVTVVPMFIAQGGHLKSDVPKLIGAARALHAGCEITLAPAVGEADGVIAAMASYALGCSGAASAGD